MIKFSGICICGHEWEDHHHSVIQNHQSLVEIGQAFRNVGGTLGEECEATQFEGMFTPTRTIYYPGGRIEKRYFKEMCRCSSYWDKEWGTQPV